MLQDMFLEKNYCKNQISHKTFPNFQTQAYQ